MGTLFLLLLLAHISSEAPVQDTVKRLGRHPRMQGCYYNAAHFDNGERILTNEPCLNCTCVDSMLMCYLRVCPFVKPLGEECIEEKGKDDCCPKIWCPEVIKEKECDDPAHHGKHDHSGCYLNDKYYPDGAMLPHDPKKPCEVCYCIRNSTSCVVQECELKIDGCTPVYKDDQCCPCRYNCTYGELTTVPPGVTPNELSDGCILNDGRFVEDGEAVNSTNPCEHCYCMRNELVCAIQECQAPGDNCKPLPTKSGRCCPDRYDCPATTGTSESSSLTTQEVTSSHIPKKDQGIKTSSQKGIGIKQAFSDASSFKPVGADMKLITSFTSESLQDTSVGDAENIHDIKSDLTEEMKDKTTSESFNTSPTSTEMAVATDKNASPTSEKSEDVHASVEEKMQYVSPVSVKTNGIKGASQKQADAKEASSKGVIRIKTFPGKADNNAIKSSEHKRFGVNEGFQEVPNFKPTLPSYMHEGIIPGKNTSISSKNTTLAVFSTPSHKTNILSSITDEEKDKHDSHHVSFKQPVSVVRIYGQNKTVTIPGVTGLIHPEISEEVSGLQKSNLTNSFEKYLPAKHNGVKGFHNFSYEVKGGGNYPHYLRPLLPSRIPGESGKLPTGKRPIPIPGEGICRVGNIVYKSGQDMESPNACKINCKCINSVMYCEDVTCDAPAKDAENCIRIQTSNDCCPRYQCSVTDIKENPSTSEEEKTTVTLLSSTEEMSLSEEFSDISPTTTTITSTEKENIEDFSLLSTTTQDKITDMAENEKEKFETTNVSVTLPTFIFSENFTEIMSLQSVREEFTTKSPAKEASNFDLTKELTLGTTAASEKTISFLDIEKLDSNLKQSSTATKTNGTESKNTGALGEKIPTQDKTIFHTTPHTFTLQDVATEKLTTQSSIQEMITESFEKNTNDFETTEKDIMESTLTTLGIPDNLTSLHDTEKLESDIKTPAIATTNRSTETEITEKDFAETNITTETTPHIISTIISLNEEVTESSKATIIQEMTTMIQNKDTTDFPVTEISRETTLIPTYSSESTTILEDSEEIEVHTGQSSSIIPLGSLTTSFTPENRLSSDGTDKSDSNIKKSSSATTISSTEKDVTDKVSAETSTASQKSSDTASTIISLKQVTELSKVPFIQEETTIFQNKDTADFAIKKEVSGETTFIPTYSSESTTILHGNEEIELYTKSSSIITTPDSWTTSAIPENMLSSHNNTESDSTMKQPSIATTISSTNVNVTDKIFTETNITPEETTSDAAQSIISLKESSESSKVPFIQEMTTKLSDKNVSDFHTTKEVSRETTLTPTYSSDSTTILYENEELYTRLSSIITPPDSLTPDAPESVLSLHDNDQSDSNIKEASTATTIRSTEVDGTHTVSVETNITPEKAISDTALNIISVKQVTESSKAPFIQEVTTTFPNKEITDFPITKEVSGETTLVPSYSSKSATILHDNEKIEIYTRTSSVITSPDSLTTSSTPEYMISLHDTEKLDSNIKQTSATTLSSTEVDVTDKVFSETSTTSDETSDTASTIIPLKELSESSKAPYTQETVMLPNKDTTGIPITKKESEEITLTSTYFSERTSIMHSNDEIELYTKLSSIITPPGQLISSAAPENIISLHDTDELDSNIKQSSETTISSTKVDMNDKVSDETSIASEKLSDIATTIFSLKEVTQSSEAPFTQEVTAIFANKDTTDLNIRKEASGETTLMPTYSSESTTILHGNEEIELSTKPSSIISIPDSLTTLITPEIMINLLDNDELDSNIKQFSTGKTISTTEVNITHEISAETSITPEEAPSNTALNIISVKESTESPIASFIQKTTTVFPNKDTPDFHITKEVSEETTLIPTYFSGSTTILHGNEKIELSRKSSSITTSSNALVTSVAPENMISLHDSDELESIMKQSSATTLSSTEVDVNDKVSAETGIASEKTTYTTPTITSLKEITELSNAPESMLSLHDNDQSDSNIKEASTATTISSTEVDGTHIASVKTNITPEKAIPDIALNIISLKQVTESSKAPFIQEITTIFPNRDTTDFHITEEVFDKTSLTPVHFPENSIIVHDYEELEAHMRPSSMATTLNSNSLKVSEDAFKIPTFTQGENIYPTVSTIMSMEEKFTEKLPTASPIQEQTTFSEKVTTDFNIAKESPDQVTFIQTTAPIATNISEDTDELVSDMKPASNTATINSIGLKVSEEASASSTIIPHKTALHTVSATTLSDVVNEISSSTSPIQESTTHFREKETPDSKITNEVTEQMTSTQTTIVDTTALHEIQELDSGIKKPLDFTKINNTEVMNSEEISVTPTHIQEKSSPFAPITTSTEERFSEKMSTVSSMQEMTTKISVKGTQDFDITKEVSEKSTLTTTDVLKNTIILHDTNELDLHMKPPSKAATINYNEMKFPEQELGETAFHTVLNTTLFHESISDESTKEPLIQEITISPEKEKTNYDTIKEESEKSTLTDGIENVTASQETEETENNMKPSSNATTVHSTEENISENTFTVATTEEKTSSHTVPDTKSFQESNPEEFAKEPFMHKITTLSSDKETTNLNAVKQPSEKSTPTYVIANATVLHESEGSASVIKSSPNATTIISTEEEFSEETFTIPTIAIKESSQAVTTITLFDEGNTQTSAEATSIQEIYTTLFPYDEDTHLNTIKHVSADKTLIQASAPENMIILHDTEKIDSDMKTSSSATTVNSIEMKSSEETTVESATFQEKKTLSTILTNISLENKVIEKSSTEPSIHEIKTVFPEKETVYFDITKETAEETTLKATAVPENIIILHDTTEELHSGIKHSSDTTIHSTEITVSKEAFIVPTISQEKATSSVFPTNFSIGENTDKVPAALLTQEMPTSLINEGTTDSNLNKDILEESISTISTVSENMVILQNTENSDSDIEQSSNEMKISEDVAVETTVIQEKTKLPTIPTVDSQENSVNEKILTPQFIQEMATNFTNEEMSDFVKEVPKITTSTVAAVPGNTVSLHDADELETDMETSPNIATVNSTDVKALKGISTVLSFTQEKIEFPTISSTVSLEGEVTEKPLTASSIQEITAILTDIKITYLGTTQELAEKVTITPLLVPDNTLLNDTQFDSPMKELSNDTIYTTEEKNSEKEFVPFTVIKDKTSFATAPTIIILNEKVTEKSPIVPTMQETTILPAEKTSDVDVTKEVPDQSELTSTSVLKSTLINIEKTTSATVPTTASFKEGVTIKSSIEPTKIFADKETTYLDIFKEESTEPTLSKTPTSKSTIIYHDNDELDLHMKPSSNASTVNYSEMKIPEKEFGETTDIQEKTTSYTFPTFISLKEDIPEKTFIPDISTMSSEQRPTYFGVTEVVSEKWTSTTVLENSTNLNQTEDLESDIKSSSSDTTIHSTEVNFSEEYITIPTTYETTSSSTHPTNNLLRVTEESSVASFVQRLTTMLPDKETNNVVITDDISDESYLASTAVPENIVTLHNTQELYSNEKHSSSATVINSTELKLPEESFIPSTIIPQKTVSRIVPNITSLEEKFTVKFPTTSSIQEMKTVFHEKDTTGLATTSEVSKESTLVPTAVSEYTIILHSAEELASTMKQSSSATAVHSIDLNASEERFTTPTSVQGNITNPHDKGQDNSKSSSSTQMSSVEKISTVQTPKYPLFISEDLSEFQQLNNTLVTEGESLIGHKISEKNTEIPMTTNIDVDREKTLGEDLNIHSHSTVAHPIDISNLSDFPISSETMAENEAPLTNASASAASDAISHEQFLANNVSSDITSESPSTTAHVSSNDLPFSDILTHHDIVIQRETLPPVSMQSPENLVSHIESHAEISRTTSMPTASNNAITTKQKHINTSLTDILFPDSTTERLSILNEILHTVTESSSTEIKHSDVDKKAEKFDIDQFNEGQESLETSSYETSPTYLVNGGLSSSISSIDIQPTKPPMSHDTTNLEQLSSTIYPEIKNTTLETSDFSSVYSTSPSNFTSSESEKSSETYHYTRRTTLIPTQQSDVVTDKSHIHESTFSVLSSNEFHSSSLNDTPITETSMQTISATSDMNDSVTKIFSDDFTEERYPAADTSLTSNISTSFESTISSETSYSSETETSVKHLSTDVQGLIKESIATEISNDDDPSGQTFSTEGNVATSQPYQASNDIMSTVTEIRKPVVANKTFESADTNKNTYIHKPLDIIKYVTSTESYWPTEKHKSENTATDNVNTVIVTENSLYSEDDSSHSPIEHDKNMTHQLETTVSPEDILYNFTSENVYYVKKNNLSTTTATSISQETQTFIVPSTTETILLNATINISDGEANTHIKNVTGIAETQTLFPETPSYETSQIIRNADHTLLPEYNMTELKVTDLLQQTMTDDLHTISPINTNATKEKIPVDSSPSPEWLVVDLDDDIVKTLSNIFPSSPASLVYEVHNQSKSSTAGTDGYTQKTDNEDDVCYFEGSVYLSSEQIPRKDNCEFCFCFKGDIICLQQTCPPPIKGCYAIPIEGFCCPRFHCPVQQMQFNTTAISTLTPYDLIRQATIPPSSKTKQTTVPTYGCQIEGKTYRLHQVVQSSSNPCMLCRCDFGGIMKCDPRSCKPGAPVIQEIAEAYLRKR